MSGERPALSGVFHGAQCTLKFYTNEQTSALFPMHRLLTLVRCRLIGSHFPVVLFMSLLMLIGCTHSPETELGRQVNIRKEATALLARDTQRIAKRRSATWLSNEPLVSWSKTPLSLRLASHKALTHQEGIDFAKEILHSMIWSANSQRPVRAFANLELGRQESRPIAWDDLALKISFWNLEGERYSAPYLAQLTVQRGMITTWSSDPHTLKLTDSHTELLPPPIIEAVRENSDERPVGN
jgi:hypothetical protein